MNFLNTIYLGSTKIFKFLKKPFPEIINFESDRVVEYIKELVLDKILFYFIEGGLSIDEIVEKGYNVEIVKWIAKAIIKNEYKRKQAPLGLKVTSKAFGTGRRMPIAAIYSY